MVEQKCLDSRLTNWREPNDLIALPAEVVAPLVASRIEKWHRFAIFGNLHFDAIGFVQIATGAGQCEVFDLGPSGKRTWDDVLNVKRCTL